ncbi:unnamed protein product [Protopolystoma xenopodis]|uniref:Uncharacterized protein n=1 Tax=Protopolystoma xenopodis TaxID=117903 RepID=A0A3S5A8A1_9PLAT|nr:unnamed protein product [Protopolystoma xenopodis]
MAIKEWMNRHALDAQDKEKIKRVQIWRLSLVSSIKSRILAERRSVKELNRKMPTRSVKRSHELVLACQTGEQRRHFGQADILVENGERSLDTSLKTSWSQAKEIYSLESGEVASLRDSGAVDLEADVERGQSMNDMVLLSRQDRLAKEAYAVKRDHVEVGTTNEAKASGEQKGYWDWMRGGEEERMGSIKLEPEGGVLKMRRRRERGEEENRLEKKKGAKAEEESSNGQRKKREESLEALLKPTRECNGNEPSRLRDLQEIEAKKQIHAVKRSADYEESTCDEIIATGDGQDEDDETRKTECPENRVSETRMSEIDMVKRDFVEASGKRQQKAESMEERRVKEERKACSRRESIGAFLGKVKEGRACFCDWDGKQLEPKVKRMCECRTERHSQRRKFQVERDVRLEKTEKFEVFDEPNRMEVKMKCHLKRAEEKSRQTTEARDQMRTSNLLKKLVWRPEQKMERKMHVQKVVEQEGVEVEEEEEEEDEEEEEEEEEEQEDAAEEGDEERPTKLWREKDIGDLENVPPGLRSVSEHTDFRYAGKSPSDIHSPTFSMTSLATGTPSRWGKSASSHRWLSVGMTPSSTYRQSAAPSNPISGDLMVSMPVPSTTATAGRILNLTRINLRR